MNYALCIAVDHYTDTSISPLRFGANDARGLALLLAERFGYSVSVCINPNASELLAAIERCTAMLKSGDKFVLTFAGHGLAKQGTTLDEMLLTATDVRTQWLRDDKVASLPGTVSLGLLRAMTAIEGVSRLFALDTCRSAEIFPGTNTRNIVLRPHSEGDGAPIRRDIQLDERSPGAQDLTVLTATALGGWAVDLEAKQHGCFTWCLMQELRKVAQEAVSVRIDGEFCQRLARAIDEEVQHLGSIKAAPEVHGPGFVLN